MKTCWLGSVLSRMVRAISWMIGFMAFDVYNFFTGLAMDLVDSAITACSDWDPCYLEGIFSEDFYDFDHLWQDRMNDADLVHAIEAIEKYAPIVEDISIDDETLYKAVEEIELEYRRSELETVQYFQFDEEGNMYIFEAGAGCTGTPHLVRPGDELIFSSYGSQVNYESDEAVKSEPLEEENGVNTCLPAGSRSYNVPLHDEELTALSHKNFSEETNKKIRWVVKMYRQWRAYRHHLGLQRIDCDLDKKATITPTSLSFALCCFLTEVKKVDGSDFPGKTLYDLVICIQFYLETIGLPWRVLSQEAFTDIKFMLDNLMKLRTSQGLGVSVRKAEVLSAMDEDLLWSMGLLGMSNPIQLLNTVVFIVSKGFALCAGKEHRALHGLGFNSQFKFMRDSDGEGFLRYTKDFGLKTNKGGLKQRKLQAKQVDLYATDDTECCPLCIILKYMSLVPKTCTCSAFYLQPRKHYFGKAWYLNRPAGVNKLHDVIKDMCKAAGLPGFNSNHSLRSTACTITT